MQFSKKDGELPMVFDIIIEIWFPDTDLGLGAGDNLVNYKLAVCSSKQNVAKAHPSDIHML